MSGDFWDDMSEAFSKDSSFDSLLQGKELDGPSFNGMRDLTDSARQAHALALPVEAGTRVRFKANLGSVLAYPDIPDPRISGTVVTVRTGSGDMTSLDDRVFVSWDDGVFRPIFAEHLRAVMSGRQAKSVRRVFSDLGDISAFFNSTARSDELVHKSTQDLWSLDKKGDSFVINRLFKDNGEPLKA